MFNRKKQEQVMEDVSGVINRIGSSTTGFNGYTRPTYSITLLGNQNIYSITPESGSVVAAQLSISQSGDTLSFIAPIEESGLIQVKEHDSIVFDTINAELSNS
ncbi:hypothetical protein VCHA53O466_50211 [Vibrio chagasii]|nr:hypothetical protein VCHA53O466_50211 [Vibrio chagasii]